MPTPSSLRLDSDWIPGAGDPGLVTLVLRNLGERPLTDFRLAFTSQFRIRPGSDIKGGRLIEQVSNHHVVAPPAGFVLAPGEAWTISADRLGQKLAHYTYGPKSAYVVLGDGALATVEVAPMTREGKAGTPLLGARSRPHPASGAPPYALLPFPLSAGLSGRRDSGSPLSLAEGAEEAQAAFEAVAKLSGRLFPNARPLFGSAGGIVCAARHETMPEEAYRIGFTAERVIVSAGGKPGFVYAFITLGQLLRGAREAPEAFAFPQDGEIIDRPRFGWRGMMLDVARQVFGVDLLGSAIDCLAWLKLNRFHLHLTDDEGWRLDIPGYPEVAEIAGWQGHGLPVPPLLGSPPTRHGLVYSRGDLAGLVERAGALAVTIVPEIDIPGHCYSLLQAIPALRDPGESGIYRSIQSFPNNALNPAVAGTYDFLRSVFAELTSIFPSPFIHVGGDEVANDAWLGSPLARDLMRKRGWTRTHQMQSHFLQRVQEMLREFGRGTGAWEEAALGGGIDPRNSYLVAWRRAASGRRLAERGYNVVMAPAEHYYLDMGQSDEWWEPGGSWAGTVTTEAAYSYEPGDDWPESLKPRLLGVQANLWSENLHERRLLDHMLFPRLSALAETAWSAPAAKDFRRFMGIEPLMPRTGER